MDKLTPPRPPLPPEAPLDAPVQDLRRFDRRERRGARFEGRAVFARVALVLASAALAAWLATEMHAVLAVGALTALEAVMFGLFVLNITWISFNSVSSVLGFLAPHRPAPAGPLREAGGRTALLWPTYNEDPARIVGAAVATLEALAARGAGERFDLFILSDTTRPDVWLAEEALVEAARRRGLEDRLFYRHRSVNRDRKVGNIADWLERWGGGYPFMLVLDADSLMEADTILELARRIASAPDAGLIQTVPRLVGATTPLGRLQQYAGRVYGPTLAHGLAAWFGNAGNFWGHNAILRTEAFASAAGLPKLPGRKPFGGLILSHDFVEAALMRRRGWAIRLAPDLGGSYEHAPPTLIEMVARDRRWAQGNLQHLALLRTAGLHPISRLHLASGAMAYLASPLWLLFLVGGILLALYASLAPPDYFPDGWALFPTWPQIDPQRAIALFGFCLGVLYAPKIVGLVAFLMEPASRGQRLRAPLDFLAEAAISALTAPILMLTQTRAVFEILAGRDSGWTPQAREADRLSWRGLWSFHRRHMIEGAILATAAGAISWSLLAWMSPAVASMLLSLPLGAFLGSKAAGAWMRRRGLMTTPEERREPEIAAAAAAARAELLGSVPPPPHGLAELLADQPALARHLAWLDARTERRRGDEPDPALAAGWLRLTEGERPAALDGREAFALMASSRLLPRVVDMARFAPREPEPASPTWQSAHA